MGSEPPQLENAIRTYHVSKSYLPGQFAIEDVSFEIAPGEQVFLTGVSGAGKTTLLKLLFGAERPSSGQIIVMGRNVGRLGEAAIPALRRRIGVIFQDFKLISRFNVEENVRMPLDVVGTPLRTARSRVFQTLKRVGLAHRRLHHPLALSGGEQQRVAIARALVNDPEVLLADEPTGNLDADLAIEIMDLVASVAARGTTVVVATHDPNLVAHYGGRSIRLENGRVLEDSGRRGA